MNDKKNKLKQKISEDEPDFLSTLNNAQKRAISSAIASDPRYKIFYLVPHLPQNFGDASIFNWYTPGLLEAAEPLIRAAELPADIREPFSSPEHVWLQRATRSIWPLITPVQTDALLQFRIHIDSHFQVIFTTNSEVADLVDEITSGGKIPVLHVSDVAADGRVSTNDLDIARLCKYIREVIDCLIADASTAKLGKEMRNVVGNSRRWKAQKHHLALGLHNVVNPNESALVAFGRKFVREKRISVPLFTPRIAEDQRYVDRICEMADAVTAERKRIGGQVLRLHDHRYVLAVSSMYWGHYEEWRAKLQEAPRDVRKQLTVAYMTAVKATTYFDTLDTQQNHPASPIFRWFVTQRSRDARAFTAGLTLLSTASLVPVLRLEPKLNQIRGDLKLLAHCVRSEVHQNSSWKTSRLIRALGIKMRALINEEFLNRIDSNEASGFIEGMKLVTDLPLEWLPTRGTPLAMRFDCCRIPPVPGNLFIATCARPPLYLSLRAFQEILVLRSFKKEDHLRSYFEHAVDTISKNQTDFKLKYKFIDIDTEAELVEQLSNYKGAVVIFDCHGSVDAELGMGTLVIGESKVSFWNLKGKCSLPPIVMFSACDTQPLDGSHSSVATSAFTLGAVSVLATMLPIFGDKAAIFNARMLWRLEAFLPAALKYRPLVSWREIVSGMLRMTHVTEIMEILERKTKLGLNKERWSEVQMEANMVINQDDAQWYEKFLDKLSQVSGRSLQVLKDDVANWAGLTDSMKYVLLGNPENLIFKREDLFNEEDVEVSDGGHFDVSR